MKKQNTDPNVLDVRPQVLVSEVQAKVKELKIRIKELQKELEIKKLNPNLIARIIFDRDFRRLNMEIDDIFREFLEDER